MRTFPNMVSRFVRWVSQFFAKRPLQKRQWKPGVLSVGFLLAAALMLVAALSGQQFTFIPNGTFFLNPSGASETYSTINGGIGAAPSAGMPSNEPSANLSYSGQLTITASNGTLITHDLGVLDGNHLAFTEIERRFSGTGIFANPGTSVFFISGSIVDNGQAFQGDLSGTVCASGN